MSLLFAASMYSRLIKVINEAQMLETKEVGNFLINKKMILALDDKYETICTLIK
jgi:hypothetical protein